jgi:ribosome-binding protein aMBF1 (putative translation factor)
MAATKTRKTSDAVKILDQMAGKDGALRRLSDDARLNALGAQLIYEARTTAGRTQKSLADLIGITQSVIARLKDADYDGHSLSMLQRIASALHKRVENCSSRGRRKSN